MTEKTDTPIETIETLSTRRHRFTRDTPGFGQWCADHPDGYVLWVYYGTDLEGYDGGTHGYLHRVGCPTVRTMKGGKGGHMLCAATLSDMLPEMVNRVFAGGCKRCHMDVIEPELRWTLAMTRAMWEQTERMLTGDSEASARERRGNEIT